MLVLSGLAALGFALATPAANAQHAGPGGAGPSSPGATLSFNGGSGDAVRHVRQRELQGVVRDASGKPMQNAIVYLKNTRTHEVESVLADSTGGYRFGDLAFGADYQLWAQVNNRTSPPKALSSYDTRDQLTVNLSVQ